MRDRITTEKPSKQQSTRAKKIKGSCALILKKHDKRHGERQQGTIGLLKYTADLINSNQMFNMLAQSQAQSQAQLLANQSALRHQMLQTHGSHQAAMSHF